ncbi:hypothetical protein [Enterovirga sp.]|uniref:hypothetical protein n=1 Tax=Enterovirga sp. TaxID=2026350 RepID=UPI002C133BB6|nr:hypothetical protein [Enterovirga sp.]HMO30276.1 hypothetical protein [Enterovirga sp.]
MACASCSGRTASSTLRYPAPSYAGGTSICVAEPTCSCCGELECLCRPRWTAGMIVTEDDLNRLDHYMTAKQRLHNRHLHGTGVVSGLIVTCHPCGNGQVQVSSGYAIGPCGEDIVVCKDDVVDICALIQRCRAVERGDVECRPWGDVKGCSDLREEWVLSIRYDEQPGRSTPMLRAEGSCECGGSCGCGGGGGCACGGHGSAPKTKPLHDPRPASCAPVVTCETYRYDVFRNPPAKLQPGPRDKQSVSWFKNAEIFECLWDLLGIAVTRPPLGDRFDRQAWMVYCRTLKQAILDYMERHGTQHCEALAAICSLPCGDMTTDAALFQRQAAEISQTFVAVLIGMIKDCLCLKLLPPVQPQACDPRVPLALVTVDTSGGCNVVEICNWTPLRPMVLSAPAIEHWLHLFDIPAQLHLLLARLCCAPIRIQPVRPTDQTIEVVDNIHANVGIAAAQPAAAQPAGLAASVEVDRLWQDAVVNAVSEALSEVVVAARDKGAAGALEAMQAIARAIRSRLGDLAARVQPAPQAEDTAALRERIETLERQVATLARAGGS